MAPGGALFRTFCANGHITKQDMTTCLGRFLVRTGVFVGIGALFVAKDYAASKPELGASSSIARASGNVLSTAGSLSACCLFGPLVGTALLASVLYDRATANMYALSNRPMTITNKIIVPATNFANFASSLSRVARS